MNKTTKDNIFKSALQGQNILKLSKEERQKAVTELLQTRSLRQLANEINIHYSTLHCWKTLRKDTEHEKNLLSFNNLINKLKSIDTANFTDWGRIEQIIDICNKILKAKK